MNAQKSYNTKSNSFLDYVQNKRSIWKVLPAIKFKGALTHLHGSNDVVPRADSKP